VPDLPPPPPLPAALTRVSTVVGVGTVPWLVALAVAVLAGWSSLAVWVCVVGTGLGGVGWAIFVWQRAAARRGSRTAQTGIET
jgi:protein-S-isoprenylcysteine O-methyltransferase Ste14